MLKAKAALIAALVAALLAACGQTPPADALKEPSLATAALPPGSLDPAFRKTLLGFGTPGGFATHTVTLPNNKALVVFVMGSNVALPGNETFIKVQRYNEDGTLDRTFGGAGNIDANLRGTAVGKVRVIPQDIVVTPEGRIFIAATGTDLDFSDSRPVIFGLTPSGVLDASFDGNGILAPRTATANPSTASISAADLSYDRATKKLTLGGTVDPPGYSFLWTYTVGVNATTSFKETVVKEPRSLKFAKFKRLSSGEMYIAAEITLETGSLPLAYLVKQLDNGQIVRKAIDAVGLRTFVTGIQVDGGRVFLAGSAFTTSSKLITQGFVARFSAETLTRDPSFGSNGIRFVSNEVRDIAFSKGSGTAKNVLVAGTDGTDYMVARMSYGGQMDNAFGKNGIALVDFSNFFNASANSLSVDSKNRIWVSGRVKADGRNRAGIARLLP